MARRLALVAWIAVSVLASGGCGDSGTALPEAEIVFTRTATEGARPDLYHMRSDGSNQRLLVKNGSGAAVSPDGRKIAFARNGAVWLMQRNGSRLRRLTTEPKARFADPAWSPDGHTVYFSQYGLEDGGGAIFLTRQDGTNLRTLVHRDTYCIERPAPSPDGRLIAYARVQDCRHGAQLSIEAVTTTGKEARLRFPLTDVWHFDPAWAPTGRRLAFAAWDVERGTQTGLYVSTWGAARPRRLTDQEPRTPAWAPDGSTVAFAREFDEGQGYTHDIWLVRPDGTGLRQVTKTAASESEPAWLPPAR